MKRILFALAAPLMLTACAGTPELVSKLNPFKIDIRQGNYVSQEMVAQLRPGQTRDQVRFILGTPLVTDIFHADRWDYVYRFKPGRGELQQRRLMVFFEDNKLVRVSGDVAPTNPSDPVDTPSAIRTVDIDNPNIKPAPAAKPAAGDTGK